MRARLTDSVVWGLLAAIYYAFFAHQLMFWTVDGLASAFSLAIGPALAVAWVGAEALFFLVPFIAVRLWSARSNRSGLYGALGSLAAFWLPAVAVAAGGLAFGVPESGFSGLGGAVTPWLALAADLAASAIGFGLVVLPDAGRMTAMPSSAAH